jgi:hypothetical protein
LLFSRMSFRILSFPFAAALGLSVVVHESGTAAVLRVSWLFRGACYLGFSAVCCVGDVLANLSNDKSRRTCYDVRTWLNSS